MAATKRKPVSKKDVKALEKKDDERRKKNRAIWLQLFIDEHFGVDIASYTTAELTSLATKLTEFAGLNVDTEDFMKPADEYSAEEMSKAGYKP